MITKITLLFLVIGNINVESGPRAGPYSIHLYKLESCKDQGSGKVVFGTRITNAGKGKYVYKENFTFGVPMDENYKQHIDLQKWGNGGWRPKFTEFALKSCEKVWNVIGDFLKSLMKSAGAPVDKCPIPAGNYKANDWLIEFNIERTVPVMEYGKYRGILQISYEDELVGCIIIYGEAIPKAG